LDIILDNSGPEIFSDLCLADWLVSKGFCGKLVFHLKCFPWFVSDATLNDFWWTLQRCSEDEDPNLSALGRKWKVWLSLAIRIIRSSIAMVFFYLRNMLIKDDGS